MTLGDRVAVMNDARVQQIGPPMELYQRPANLFVAGFMGSPEMNLYPCTTARRDGLVRLASGGFRVAVAAGQLGTEVSDAVVAGIRPQDVELTAPDQADMAAVVELVEALGNDALVHLSLGGAGGAIDLRAIIPEDRRPRAGESVGVRMRGERLHFFDAVSGNRIQGSASSV